MTLNLMIEKTCLILSNTDKGVNAQPYYSKILLKFKEAETLNVYTVGWTLERSNK